VQIVICAFGQSGYSRLGDSRFHSSQLPGNRLNACGQYQRLIACVAANLVQTGWLMQNTDIRILVLGPTGPCTTPPVASRILEIHAKHSHSNDRTSEL